MSSEVKSVSLGSGPNPALWPTSPDPSINILEPALQKLPSLEAQQVADVLEDCLHRVKIVAMLPAVLHNLDPLSPSLSQELIVALRGHRLLVERLDGLGGPTGGMQGEGSGEAAERPGAELEKTFQASLRNVLRRLRDHPADLWAVRAEGEVGGGVVGEGMQGLIRGLQGLQTILVGRLLTDPVAERHQAQHVQDLAHQHEEHLEVLAGLEEKIAALTKEKDAEISKKDAVIAELQNSVQQMGNRSRDLDLAVLRAKQEAESVTKAWEGKQALLQRDIDALTLQLNTLVHENFERERVQRKKRSKVETEIENWFQKYDTDMGEKQTELEEVGTAYEEEKQELKELEEAYSVLAVEYDQIMEERRRAEEEQREALRELGLKTGGAVVIQAWWRGHCVRKAMKAKSKSKKPKKGKGKKGK